MANLRSKSLSGSGRKLSTPPLSEPNAISRIPLSLSVLASAGLAAVLLLASDPASARAFPYENNYNYHHHNSPFVFAWQILTLFLAFCAWMRAAALFLKAGTLSWPKSLCPSNSADSSGRSSETTQDLTASSVPSAALPCSGGESSSGSDPEGLPLAIDAPPMKLPFRLDLRRQRLAASACWLAAAALLAILPSMF